MQKDLILQCSLFSHFDSKLYSPEYVLQKSMLCKNIGVSMIHVHLNKFETMNDFLKLAHLLEIESGPLLNISASDTNTVIKCGASKLKSIACAAIQGGDANVFGNAIHQTISKACNEIERLLDNEIIPEISVFNFESIENCVELCQRYGRQFYVGVYMGYPGGMEATIQNVERIMNTLNMASFISYTIYNNQDDELVKKIVDIGGHLRSGLEDTIFCGKSIAEDALDIIKYLNGIIDSEKRKVTLFNKDSFKKFLLRS